jgi:uncharacterized membrane protein YkgB
MNYLVWAVKIILFISIVNVWLFRFNKATPWRGGEAKSMKDEFKAYGLPETLMYVIGGLKLLAALAILVSIWVPHLAFYGATLMAVLMLGAIAMHIKVSDPLKKSLPAFIFLILSLFIIAIAKGII